MKFDPVCPDLQNSQETNITEVWRLYRPHLISALSARYKDISLAEDALSEAVLAAQSAWKKSLPDNPSGWLYRVACRKAVDQLRRRGTQEKLSLRLGQDPTRQSEMTLPDTLSPPDHRLGFFFACAHPCLAPDSQIALMLFHLTGLSTSNIAQALFMKPSSVQQKLKRARDKLLKNAIGYDIPQPSDWPDRLPVLLSTLEILYDRSFSDLGGGLDIEAYARDALQLAETVAACLPDESEAQSFAAMLYLCEARRRSRLGPEKEFIPFDGQDISLWSKKHLARAAEYIEKARRALPHSHCASSSYALRAHIQTTYIIARQRGEDPSPKLLGLYDSLISQNPTPVAMIARALVISRLKSPSEGLSALADIAKTADISAMASWYLAKAEMCEMSGEEKAAVSSLNTALEHISGTVELTYIKSKRDNLLRKLN